MNRKEIKDKFRGKSFIANQVRQAFDDIYDDFESRTCENCKQNDTMCTYQESIKVYCKITRGEKYICDFRNFGCNRFERKDKLCQR